MGEDGDYRFSPTLTSLFGDRHHHTLGTYTPKPGPVNSRRKPTKAEKEHARKRRKESRASRTRNRR